MKKNVIPFGREKQVERMRISLGPMQTQIIMSIARARGLDAAEMLMVQAIARFVNENWNYATGKPNKVQEFAA